MPIKLETLAEREAQKAEKLAAFGSLNLLHIKRQLAELLKLIGRDGIFDEYTQHDIGHVDKMLAMLDWLVPDETKEVMTPTDWLLVVLGIYFHDVGMLVTREEFSQRERSGFRDFADTVLFAGEQGEEYRHKVAVLEGDTRDRFLYQEFVRYFHADRIHWWISGSAASKFGIAKEAAKEINALLAPLGNQFSRDLAFVAESHHLDDLDDIGRYRVSQPYGDSDAETGNLQYAAVLLRATDLLHITADRTPAIAFRLINPVDPLSQREWAKQMAVTRVRSKIGSDEDGTPDPEAPRDTVEVHAFFKKEDGFFGLTSYLSYVAQQLSKCHEWIGSSARRKLAPHMFPWSKLDDANIETDGFIRDAFQFTIDQAKILDLLTGHTLYNDPSVVLRELVQNALDAIRLKLYENPDSPPGEVRITWDSRSRLLTVRDNGTGMTQETISNHLLRVGASLYQDPSFKKSHPGFASISRFGIGVLSTFMVADSVEIITCHPQDSDARRLALRSVHGRYLIRLLDKQSDAVTDIFPHGTTLRLRVRQTVKAQDFLNIARHWVVIPNCNVSVTIDDRDPVPIGFATPKDALVRHLRNLGHKVVEDMTETASSSEDQRVCVVQRWDEGVAMAYAVRWSPYFHDWAFMPAPSTYDESGTLPIGTCVEGVRIDTHTPGFTGRGLLALVNSCGEKSPKTNVARSGLEATPELDVLLAAVYRAYCKHAKEEISNLTNNRGHSLTWAIQEAQYLLSPLVRSERDGGPDKNIPLNKDLLNDELGDIRFHLIETTAGREAISTKQLREQAQFWTITCPLFQSAEDLIRETSGNASIRSVVSALGTDVQFPDDPILCQASDFDSCFIWMAFESREISKIVARKELRRLDLLWRHTTKPARWLTLPRPWSDWFERAARELWRGNRRFMYLSSSVAVLQGQVEMEGLSGVMGLRHGGATFFVGDNPATQYVRKALQTEMSTKEHSMIGCHLLSAFLLFLGRSLAGVSPLMI